MDMFFGILNLFWQIISSLSVIVTLFCFVYPEGGYVCFKKMQLNFDWR